MFIFFSSKSQVLTKAELKHYLLNEHVRSKFNMFNSPVHKIRVGDVIANIEEIILYKYKPNFSYPITTLEIGVFSGLINLTSLNLNTAKMTTLDNNFFEGL